MVIFDEKEREEKIPEWKMAIFNEKEREEKIRSNKCPAAVHWLVIPFHLFFHSILPL